MTRLKKSMRWSIPIGTRTFIIYGITPQSNAHRSGLLRMIPPGMCAAPAGYYSREKNIIVDDPYPVTMQDGRTVYG